MTTLAQPSAYQRWRRRFITPETIYGTLIVSSIIAVADEDEPLGVIVFFVVLSAGVFYLAHVFAGTIAHQGAEDERVLPLGEALHHSAGHALGLLYAAVGPTIVLVLGMIAGLDSEDTQSFALGFGVLLLLFMGWQAMAERGARWYGRLLGSVVTGILGIFVIILEAISH